MNNEIPIAVVRKSQFTEYELHLLRNHTWFLSEHKGTMMFRPSTYMTDRETKLFLKEYVSLKRSVLI